MKCFTNEEITAMRININNNIVYCGIRNEKGTGRIYKQGNYIAWQNFGQSAIENNDKALRWLLEEIFDKCETVSPAIWSNYHINYVPDNPLYKGIDLSREHPNTFGI